MRAWRLGSFQVFAEAEPFRIAVHVDGRPFLAERARPDGSAFEFRTASGWHSISALKSARRERTGGPGRERIELEVEAPGAGAVRLHLQWLDALGALALRWEFPGERVLALRDDFVTDAAESLHGVSAETPLLLPDGEPPAAAARPGERWMLSSRGYALRARSTPGASLHAFFPDPDSLRIQSGGATLELILLAGEPRQTLPRIRSLSSSSSSSSSSPSFSPPSAASAASSSAAASPSSDVTSSPGTPSPDAADDGEDHAGGSLRSRDEPARARRGLWLRLDRLPDRAGREGLLEELRRCGFPIPALVIGGRDEDGALFETWTGSADLADSLPVRSGALVRTLPGGDPWRELREAVRRSLDRSLTGIPEWVSVSRRDLERVGGASSTAPSPGAPRPEGPVPRRPDDELAARLLAVAAVQPLLCVDWDGGELRFAAGEATTAAVRRLLLLQGALGRLANGLSEDETEGRLPLWRHLFVESPDDPVAWEPRDQWLFGPDVMVAPVLGVLVSRRVAYFPRGTWVEVGREKGGQVVRGPKRALIDVPPGEIGLFERRDARWGVSQYLSEVEPSRK